MLPIELARRLRTAGLEWTPRAGDRFVLPVSGMADSPMLKGMEELDAFRQMREWAKLTETGDRAELTFLPDDSDLWARLDARRDTCTGQKCSDFNDCFVTAMHGRARDADLIIVNHHLFFADLALKHDDFGSILPEYSAVVFDEAHEIEDQVILAIRDRDTPVERAK